MGVQYQGAIAARSDARFSTTSGNQRAPDLELQPCKEGVDFSLRLVQANRMSKVVEIQCEMDGEEKKGRTSKQLTPQDVQKLFLAIGGNEEGDEEEDLEDINITDDYQPEDTTIYSGLPQLESLSIIGNEQSPSFIRALIKFLSVSGSFPRFTRISLQGVNLRGDILELRALAEAFRLHPHIQHVHMVACWFTPEQQANMECLEDVFKKQQEQPRSSVASQRASLLQMRQLVLEHAGDIKENNVKSATVHNTQQKQRVEVENSPIGEMWWGERLLRSCFCFW